MNREYRGVRLDNKEWVYGYYVELPVDNIGETIFFNNKLVCNDTVSYIISIYSKQYSDNQLDVIEYNIYEVLFDTIGQFTGCYDKNKNKIFEDDILMCTKIIDGCAMHTCVNAGVVKFRNGLYVLQCSDGSYISLIECITNCECEIVGNVYDNKDLL